MDSDKVIIDRGRIEELERESRILKSHTDVICVTHSYNLWAPPSISYKYEGKDERIKKIVGIANEKDAEVKKLRKELDEIGDLIETASFIKRLKYLFTKELA